jgi:DNA-binding NarL/FixJ family response regulator
VSKRCLVADDHPALVAAVAAFLAAHAYEVVGPATDGQQAVDLAAAEAPDVALVDLRMPRLFGSDLVREVVAASPNTRVVVYTADADARLARETLDAGAVGVVLKESPLDDLVRALRSVSGGHLYIDPALAGGTATRGQLTARERDVLSLLSEGLPQAEIGARLGISGETVRTHLRKASLRLGASTRTQAVATALRLGLIA